MDIEKCSLEDKARAFFRLRFGKSPTQDPTYFEEWLDRIKEEEKLGFLPQADKESQAVWKIVKNACSVGD